MKIYLLGICGTFMAGIALIARERGIEVAGSDSGVYPPMSTQLEQAGIRLHDGYRVEDLPADCDMFIVGNAITRGNAQFEHILERGLPYTSAPQWLYEQVLRQRWVLAVAGTHGKTTTSSMLAWILEHAGLEPGYLIGGIGKNFSRSARLGDSPFFVIEADEYDSALFDKRSKFVHYHPRTLILNNLEFDHADIFDDLAMIQRQFHHLLRTVPGSGLILAPGADAALQAVLDMGCWTPLERFALDGGGRGWSASQVAPGGSGFTVSLDGVELGRVAWALSGAHNVSNGLAAIAAARHAGVPPGAAIEALGRFRNVKRRMELCGEVAGVRVYDDFAHHPTAIATTLQGLRETVANARIIAILEPRSNTMRMGVHSALLPASLSAADEALVYAPDDLGWDAAALFSGLQGRVGVYHAIEDIVRQVERMARPGDQILVMSNGGFGGIHQRLLQALRSRGTTGGATP